MNNMLEITFVEQRNYCFVLHFNEEFEIAKIYSDWDKYKFFIIVGFNATEKWIEIAVHDYSNLAAFNKLLKAMRVESLERKLQGLMDVMPATP